MRVLWETALVIAIAALSAAWNAASATALPDLKCVKKTCVDTSRGCAYGGTQNPPPCDWCYTSTPGVEGWFCEWAPPPNQCVDTGLKRCGWVVSGQCSAHLCSGGTVTNVDCSVIKCNPQGQPVP